MLTKNQCHWQALIQFIDNLLVVNFFGHTVLSISDRAETHNIVDDNTGTPIYILRR